MGGKRKKKKPNEKGSQATRIRSHIRLIRQAALCPLGTSPSSTPIVMLCRHYLYRVVIYICGLMYLQATVSLGNVLFALFKGLYIEGA